MESEKKGKGMPLKDGIDAAFKYASLSDKVKVGFLSALFVFIAMTVSYFLFLEGKQEKVNTTTVRDRELATCNLEKEKWERLFYKKDSLLQVTELEMRGMREEMAIIRALTERKLKQEN